MTEVVYLYKDPFKIHKPDFVGVFPGPGATFHYEGTYEHEAGLPIIKRIYGSDFRGPKRIQRIGTLLPHLYRCCTVYHDGEGKDAWFASNEVYSAWKDLSGIHWEEAVIDKLVDYGNLAEIDYTGFEDYREVDELPDLKLWLSQFPHCPHLLPEGFRYYELFLPEVGSHVLPKFHPRQRSENEIHDPIRAELMPGFLKELSGRLFEEFPVIWMSIATPTSLLMRADCFEPIAPLLDEWYYSWKTYTILG